MGKRREFGVEGRELMSPVTWKNTVFSVKGKETVY
jgi:hypothetical protein